MPPEISPEAAPEADDGDADQPPPAAGIRVDVSDTQNHFRPGFGAVESLVTRALKVEGVQAAEISVVIVDDATIRRINRDHLGHDWATDVVTFPLSGPDDDELSGEIVVSAQTATTVARDEGVPVWNELILYIVHGLLHLRGLDDTTDAARAVMRRREGEVLAALGLTNTYRAGPDAASVSNAAGTPRGESTWPV